MMLKVGSMSSWVLYYPSQLFLQVEAFQKFHTEKQGLCWDQQVAQINIYTGLVIRLDKVFLRLKYFNQEDDTTC